MNTTKVMKQGDLLPSLQVFFSYADPTLTLDIPTGSPLVFTMRAEGSDTPKINRAAATIVSSSGGTVVCRYDWADGDTDTVGDYRAEFEVTLNGDQALTMPTEGYLRVRIEDDLA
jgi:hypothetical protein